MCAMAAVVGVCLLSERTALVKTLSDDVKELYKRIRGNTTELPNAAKIKSGNTTVQAQKFVPVTTIFLDYKDESFFMKDKTMSVMDLIGGSNNTAPNSTFQSIMPSLSALFNTPFVQGAFRIKLISTTGPEISFIVMVVGPPAGFIRKPTVASSSSVVETSSNADVDLIDTVKLNALMLKSTKLVSASSVRSMTVGEIHEQCNSLDSQILMRSLKYFKDYIFQQSKGSMPPSTTVLLNTPVSELIVGNVNEGPKNKIVSYTKDSSHNYGVVLPVGHGKTTLVSKHPDMFVEIDGVFTDDENKVLDDMRSAILSDGKQDFTEYDLKFNEYASSHMKNGDYSNKIILARHRNNLLPLGVRVLGEFKIEKRDDLLKHIEKNKSLLKPKEDLMLKDWDNMKGDNVVVAEDINTLHDKLFDVISSRGYKTTGDSKGNVNNDTSSKVNVCFKNGFPSGIYSLMEFEKAGIHVLGSDVANNSDIIIDDSKTHKTTRRIPDALKKALANSHIKTIKIDSSKLSERDLIGQILAL
ncbi:minor core protein [Scaphoideus titanus reo-like virus 1]|nr:minor core protein [Scaphoideus titanus reo-like virus 1]